MEHQSQSQYRNLERRERSRRFGIAAPVRFHWRGTDGVCHEGKGTTRDISLHGVFVWTHEVPVPGATVEVNINIPSLVRNGVGVSLNGMGTVLRADPPNGQPKGFAAEMNFQKSRTGDSIDSDSETQIH